MKKLLLSLCALFAAASMNAQYAAGDYIYTATAKYKVQSVLDVAQPGADWNNYSSEIFSPYTAANDDDYNGIQSVRSEEGDFISLAVDLEYGAEYLVTMKFKATADGSTSITDGGMNQVDAWLAPTNQGGARAGSTNIDYQQVATTATLKANEWVEISWAFVDTLTANAEENGGKLNLLFSRISSENIIATNLQILKVSEVYDTRISDKQFAFAEKLLADPNFNTDAAADAKATVEDDIYGLKAMYDVNHPGYDPAAEERPFDHKEEAEDLMSAFFEDLAVYLDVESVNLNSYLDNIDITSIGAYGRGRFSSAGCLTLDGGNWGHFSGADYLRSAIQKNYANTATLTIKSTEFPAGKYYFTCEVRNARTSAAWPCDPLIFTLSTEGCTMSVGKTEVTIDEPIYGQEYQKYYLVGEVDEAGNFTASFYWPGVSSGGAAFEIRDLQVRCFDKTAPEQIDRIRSWNTFIVQWNAAIGARNTLMAKAEDANYPWANDTIQGALNRWDPFYNKVISDGWVDSDNKDTGVATNEELVEWATVQGFPADIYGPEGSEPVEDYDTYSKYAVVRGYQYANNYIVAQNKPIQDTQAKITECWAEYKDPKNSEADHETFDAIIKNAEQTLADILANTNDDKYETDSQTLTDLIATLEQARIDFVNSGILTPIVNIDFSGGFTPVYGDPEDPETITSYVINGKTETYDGVGTMVFPTPADVQPVTEDGHYWQLGFGDVLNDVLRVGSSEVYVDVPVDQIGDNDILEINFDAWLGNLSKGFFTVEMRNADGQRLAGFSIDSYNSNVEFNTFNNQTGQPNDLTASSSNGGDGMNIRQYKTSIGSSSAGNADICVNNNKSSFTLIYDYKANAMKGKIVNVKNGTCDGAYMPMLFINDNTITDNKVARFVVTSSYKSANSGAQARRCWFDNLVMYKYKSGVDGPLFEPKSTPEDVDGDGKVNISDVVKVINQIASGEYDKAFDVDGNGSINITDVVHIINKIAGVEN